MNLEQKTPQTGAAGTTAQSPRWEGPPETRPSGYLDAKDDAIHARDAFGENLEDPERRHLGEAHKVKGDDHRDSDGTRLSTKHPTPNAGHGAVKADVTGRTGS
ncbi:hypothetical protein BJF93_06850 [Xaviernesmea oryzae]|uniref:Uncharacterized protein n=1 Tax=Xaviernesmea oryzae TaxID=464029 RepID=A0A1Q9ASG3_9HYPH|nr:hypothetical protein BJF93_06850 [Xaviernesmea oryzae]SEL42099.1 hypothetical protein SAMN04487976_10842 [Xaviernesmea oryzae]